MKNKPAYSVESVDHALKLALLLQQEGALRVTDAADRLGVSRSTAHRLLAMLVYRDFASQGDDRRYRPGPALRPLSPNVGPIDLLRKLGTPELRDLAARVRETANLQVRVGREVRFLASAESDQVLRVGDRTGAVLPAHLASGGKTLLAALDEAAVAQLYDGQLDPTQLAQLQKDLALVRKRGFAINDQKTEDGVIAVSVLIAPHGEALAALAIAMPAFRFNRERLKELRAELEQTASGITAAIEDGYCSIINGACGRARPSPLEFG